MGYDADPRIEGVFINEIEETEENSIKPVNKYLPGFLIKSFFDRSDISKLLRKLAVQF